MDWTAIGSRIRKQREYLGYTREQFAELLEVTPENLRIRKTILNHEKRMKASHGGKKK